MTVRNDCRIEWTYTPVVVSASGRRLDKGDPILPGTNVVQVASGVSFDLCFAVGDCVLVKPWLIDGHSHTISNHWYQPFPKHPVMFLGLDGFVDDNDVVRQHLKKGNTGMGVLRQPGDYTIDDPPLPFFDPNVGIIHLPLSAIDQVLTKDGPRRSRWVIQETTSMNML